MNFKVGFPQIIMMLILAINLSVCMRNHGEKMPERKYDWGAQLFATIIELALLKWGGFF
jgi:hypothetical protein